jgi:hypothetical protein
VVYENLRNESIEQVLERVQALTSVASQDQVQSVMALLARCTIESSKNLRETSTEIRQAADQIHHFNTSTTELTKQIIRLNRLLTWATVVIAFGTLAATAAFITIFCTKSA